MAYWKFEGFIERLNKRNDDINSRRKKEEEEHKKSQSSSGLGNINPSSFIKNFQRPRF